MTFRPFDKTRGGPLFEPEKRLGTMKENAPLTKRRAIYGALPIWLPLLILSAVQGRVVPVVPLLLTVMPLKDLLRLLFKVLM